jgi:hypothetical protein
MLQTTETRPGDFCRRCVGKQAIERSIRSLMLRTQRFGRHRATSRGDLLWAAKTIDGLSELLRDTRHA